MNFEELLTQGSLLLVSLEDKCIFVIGPNNKAIRYGRLKEIHERIGNFLENYDQHHIDTFNEP